MKTLLICHHGATLDREGMLRWLASFSEVAGVVILRERAGRTRQRVKSQLRRAGLARFLDVLAFRAYYRLLLASEDRRWEEARMEELRAEFPRLPDAPVLETHSPNSPEAEAFIRRAAPDLVLARCKTLIKENVFSIPRCGTFVMHPGVAPEYRNSHGCFWALARRDLGRVGMTLLRIDKGVDTGPVYGYYSYPFDEVAESHVRIQHRVVFDNLPQIAARLRDICEGRAAPLDARGRPSAAWGQPWLTTYLGWKRAARRDRAAGRRQETGAGA